MPLDAKVITFDAHTWFNTVLDAPATYGFTNVTGYDVLVLSVQRKNLRHVLVDQVLHLQRSRVLLVQ